MSELEHSPAVYQTEQTANQSIISKEEDKHFA